MVAWHYHFFIIPHKEYGNFTVEAPTRQSAEVVANVRVELLKRMHGAGHYKHRILSVVEE